MLYMFTRLVVNISQIYIPMYVSGSLQLAKHYIAVIPLVMFVSSFLTSFIMKPVNALIGRKATYFIGSMLVVASCCWMWFLSKHNGLLVIGSSILLGAGCSTILVTSLSITADLIGIHSVSEESWWVLRLTSPDYAYESVANFLVCFVQNSGAFVYGSMSFTDKLSNGIAVALIQYFHPCK